MTYGLGGDPTVTILPPSLLRQSPEHHNHSTLKISNPTQTTHLQNNDTQELPSHVLFSAPILPRKPTFPHFYILRRRSAVGLLYVLRFTREYCSCQSCYISCARDFIPGCAVAETSCIAIYIYILSFGLFSVLDRQ